MARIPTRQKEIRAERRAMAIELLGGKCAKCGSTDRLQFDHVNNDREGLRGLVSQLFACKLERLMAELEKCQLLCMVCHGEKTRADHGFTGYKHGMLSMYTNQKCRCDECKGANAAYMKARVSS